MILLLFGGIYGQLYGYYHSACIMGMRLNIASVCFNLYCFSSCEVTVLLNGTPTGALISVWLDAVCHLLSVGASCLELQAPIQWITSCVIGVTISLKLSRNPVATKL